MKTLRNLEGIAYAWRLWDSGCGGRAVGRLAPQRVVVQRITMDERYDVEFVRFPAHAVVLPKGGATFHLGLYRHKGRVKVICWSC